MTDDAVKHFYAWVPITDEMLEDRALYGPDGEPWCRFIAGSLWCANGERCLNPNHRKRTDETSEA
jgi:hypothetical protein